MKQITFKQYKAIDIAILSVLLFVFEILGIYASEKWFSHSGISLVPLISLTPLVMVIMMMRWSEFAFVSALVGGVSYCLACGGNYKQYITYCIGNLFGLLVLLIIKKIGKKEIREKTAHLVLISISTYLFITVGRWLVSLIFEPSLTTIVRFITTDIISLVVLIVGVISLRKSDGILEDQKAYLLRLDREKREVQEKRESMASGAYGVNSLEYDDDYDEDDYDDDYPEDFQPDDLAVEQNEFSAPQEDEHSEGNEQESESAMSEPEKIPDTAPPVEQDEASSSVEDNNNDEFNSEDNI